jgi:hypothetical protein
MSQLAYPAAFCLSIRHGVIITAPCPLPDTIVDDPWSSIWRILLPCGRPRTSRNTIVIFVDREPKLPPFTRLGARFITELN